jgi:hypothetical protein
MVMTADHAYDQRDQQESAEGRKQALKTARGPGEILLPDV